MPRAHLWAALVGLFASSVATACADGGGDDGSVTPGGGKADDGVSENCITEWTRWFLERYAPMSCADGPACVGKVSLSTRPSCDGGVAHDTWMLGLKKHVLIPWSAREAAAQSAFYAYDTPAHQNTALYAEAVQPTAAEHAAFDRLLAVRVLATADDYAPWFADLAVWIEGLARPVRSMNNATVGGRLLCVGVDLAQCHAEPSLLLNPGEREVLRLIERAAPAVTADGHFATWVSDYFGFLAGGDEASTTGFVFPETDMEPSLFPYEYAFFEYLLSLAPDAVGERDSLAWFDHYTAVVLGTELDQQNSLERLVLFETSRPAALVGLPAYTSFLGTDDGLSGLALFEGDDADKVALILGAKPCARTDTELQAMQALYQSYRGVAQASAGPVRCAD